MTLCPRRFRLRRMVIHFHTHTLVFLSHLFSSRERMCSCVARMRGLLLLLQGCFPFEAEYCALMLPSMCNYGNRERINFSNVLTNSSVSVQS
jgi:hypothetical protein